MGFIKAFTGALGGAFADQWKDFYKPMDMVPATAWERFKFGGQAASEQLAFFVNLK